MRISWCDSIQRGRGSGGRGYLDKYNSKAPRKGGLIFSFW